MPRISTQPLADQPLGALPSTGDRRPVLAPLAARRRETTGSHVPHQSPDQAHATSMPDTTWPISRTPARLIPGWVGRPVSMSSNADFDTSSVDRSRSSSWPTPDALKARLAPRRSPPRLLTAATRGGLRPPPAGRPRRPTSRSDWPLHLRCSTASTGPTFHIDLLMRSWHTLPVCVLPTKPLCRIARP